MLVETDKGKTIVIINSNEYSKKVHTFLTDNFHLLQKDPTDKHQKLIQKTLQQCNLNIDKQKIKYLNQKKPLPPTVKAHLKLHKRNIPIRPVINNINAPSYKTAEHLVGILNTLHSTTTTMLKTPQTDNMKDLYVNIPIEDTLTMKKSMLLKSNDIEITQQIITFIKLTVSQNYFTIQNKIYQPEERSIHGFNNLKYNNQNISTTPGGHIYKTTSRHKKHNILHKIHRHRNHV